MTSQQIDSFLTFLRNCEQRYHMAEADELEANAITNDIHHSLELEVHSDGEVLALGLELASIRRKRREAKDILSETTWKPAVCASPISEPYNRNRTAV